MSKRWLFLQSRNNSASWRLQDIIGWFIFHWWIQKVILDRSGIWSDSCRSQQAWYFSVRSQHKSDKNNRSPFWWKCLYRATYRKTVPSYWVSCKSHCAQIHLGSTNVRRWFFGIEWSAKFSLSTWSSYCTRLTLFQTRA